jgi:uncharacterized iron-regulated membrane protein
MRNNTSAHSSLYRAVWRWHFYAGLIVMPFLILLAVTGSLYLFKPEIERLVYRDLIVVSAKPTQVTPAAMKASVERALGGHVIQMTLPGQPDQSAQMLVRLASGEVRTAYADPYDGRFLGDTSYGGVMQFIRKIHSLQLFGFWASSLIEIAAGWAIIMVLTGIFMWWPRGATGGVVTIRGQPRQRMFWRDTHAVIGAVAGLFIVFLAVTGMPWSMFWGDQVQGWIAAQNLSRPAPPAEVTPAFLLGVPRGEETHDHGHSELKEQLPWAMQQAGAPQSGAAEGAPLSLDEAVARFEALGLPRPFAVQPPEGPRGAWAATHTPDQAENVRLVYLDQRSGAVIGDVRFADFGPAAQAIEWGIAVHQGQQYGPLNRYLMLAACIAIVVLAITALTMWWMRRPKGSLGAPPVPEQKGAAYVVLGAVAVIGVIYPLTGASIAAALAVDWLVQRVQTLRA